MTGLDSARLCASIQTYVFLYKFCLCSEVRFQARSWKGSRIFYLVLRKCRSHLNYEELVFSKSEPNQQNHQS